MINKAFELLLDAEKSWWYWGRKNAAKRVLIKFSKENGEACDVGAGYGGMKEVFNKATRIVAYEPNREIGKVCEARGYSEVVYTEEILANMKGRFSVVGAFDVLEHIEDDKKFLSMIVSTLAPGGLVVATVPAFQFLWGVHDVEHQHFRRYNKRQIKELFDGCGLEIDYASYWNCLLFFPAALVRLTGKSGGSALRLPEILNKILMWYMSLETSCIPSITFPFGTSIIVCGRAKQTS